MGVAEWNVCCQNILSDSVRFGNGNAFVRESRPADLDQRIIAHRQPVPNAQPVADSGKRLTLTRLRALAITHVQRCRFVVAPSESRTDAGIHASAEENDSARFLRLNH